MRQIARALTLFMFCGATFAANLAPIQLTNPAVDGLDSETPSAWIVDENMGVIYCELIGSGEDKRVRCFDSNGALEASSESRR